jgi:hypothetical protein
MPPLGRHLSASSIGSSASSVSATSAASDSSARTEPDVQTRRRPTPTQLNVLQGAFEEKPYLSREERVALAEETGMCVLSLLSVALLPLRCPLIDPHTGSSRLSPLGFRTAGRHPSAPVHLAHRTPSLALVLPAVVSQEPRRSTSSRPCMNVRATPSSRSPHLLPM